MMWAAGTLAAMSSLAYPAISAMVSCNAEPDQQGLSHLISKDFVVGFSNVTASLKLIMIIMISIIIMIDDNNMNL